MRVRLKSLDQQVLVVTGASSGNSLAIARAAARRGAAVVLAARNLEALECIAADIRGNGGRAAVCAADVSSADDVEAIARTAEAAFGGFDTWVNNAAAATYGTLEQVPFADHRRVFDVSYFGVLYGSLVAARGLRQRGGGALINIGSILGDRAIIQQGPYSAAKHAVQGLTDTFRMELERERAGISVTLIKPGAIKTPYPEHAHNYMDQAPRLPPPLYDLALVADAVLFAVQTPRRQLYVGGGLLISLVGQLAPRLTDVAMETIGTELQQKPRDPGIATRRDNLFEPRSDGTTGGAQAVGARTTSLTLEAQKMPLGLPVAVAATGLSIALGLGKAVNHAIRHRR